MRSILFPELSRRWSSAKWPIETPPSLLRRSACLRAWDWPNLSPIRWGREFGPNYILEWRFVGLCLVACPRLHWPPSSATAMRMTAIRTQIQRTPQDRSVRRAEKRAHRAGTLRVLGSIRPSPGAVATFGNAQGENTCSAVRFRRSCHQTAGHLGNAGLNNC